jgi:hypothetical protein
MELPGGENDGCLFHFRKGVEFRLDLGGAIGAIDVFDSIYFLWHGDPS